MSGSKIFNRWNNRCYEYKLVARPGKQVKEKVTAQREYFHKEYNAKRDITSNSDITVANFIAKEEMENTVIRWIQRICRRHTSFMVSLNNYGGFPPHTIYLRIQDERPLLQLGKELSVVNAYVTSCACPPMITLPRPHLDIAENLSEGIFSRALPYYARQSFHESFMVNELLLIKRRDEFDIGKTIIVFALLPARGELVA